MSPPPRPAVLCILDGWGHRTDLRYNAILDARTPNYDRLIASCPQGLIDASETFVGLPKGQMGNSEVGHMNLGAGRVAVPDLPRIDMAIADGSLAKNKVLTEFIFALKKGGGACHLMGLASPGGVHSHQEHLIVLANLIAGAGVAVWIHAFLDGRDMPPRSAHECLQHIQARLKPGLPIHIATVGGRFYAMDRDKRWERVTVAYDAMVDAKGQTAKTPDQAVDKGYAARQDDEFIDPTIIEGYPGMTDGDGVLMFNYRSDRAREILTCLLDPMFDGFKRSRLVKFASAVGMVEYSAALNEFLKTLFAPNVIKMGLGETIAKAGLKQLRIAETEKYAHVTFFFNGGEERVFDGEERIMIPSPKVKTYDLKPEMSAREITDNVLKQLNQRIYDFILINFANPDMVAHTGNIPAAIKACEATDECVGKIVNQVLAVDGACLITADHGNVEEMIDPVTGGVDTEHSTYPVPIICVAKDLQNKTQELPSGMLADVAPTALHLLGLVIPSTMNGRNLLTYI